MAKYDPLERHLAMQKGDKLILSFRDIEAILGARLPLSAHRYGPWWANEPPDKTRHTQSRAWRLAGWAAFPNLEIEKVTFVRE